MADTQPNSKKETRQALSVWMIIGFGIWFSFSETDAQQATRLAAEEAQIAAFASLPPEQRYPTVIKKIFEKVLVVVGVVHDEIRISHTITQILSESDVCTDMQIDIETLIKGARKYALDLNSKTIRILVSAKTIDKYGNPSGEAVAAEAVWKGVEIMKVSDENALIVPMDLVESVKVRPLGMNGAMEFCTEGRIHSPPEQFCRLAIGRTFPRG